MAFTQVPLTGRTVAYPTATRGAPFAGNPMYSCRIGASVTQKESGPQPPYTGPYGRTAKPRFRPFRGSFTLTGRAGRVILQAVTWGSAMTSFNNNLAGPKRSGSRNAIPCNHATDRPFHFLGEEANS